MNSDLAKQFQVEAVKTLEYERQLWQSRYSPCGKYLVACAFDATIQRWNVEAEEPKPLKSMNGHNGWLQCFGFQTSRKHVITADSWGKLLCRPYEEDDPKEVWSVEEAHDGWIRCLAISPNGELVATGGNDAFVRIWNSADGKLVKEFKHDQRIFSVCFHPTKNVLFAGDLHGVVHQRNLDDEKIERTFDAKVLYQHHRIQECGGARHLQTDAEGKTLICAGMKTPSGGFGTGTPTVLLFDCETGKQTEELTLGPNNAGFIYDAVFHPAGFIMSAGGAFPGSGQLSFWKPGEKAAFLSDKKIANGRSISLHPDGKRLAVTISNSRNANGRPLQDGKYIGGKGVIHLLKFKAAEEKA
ncbi:MAG: hypothetical protein CMJ78_24930 [Planctomycetaceae bacterium]|nr:hypothetical protein [Planctomycetaceae bacterium]